jgi:hypothetical protein
VSKDSKICDNSIQVKAGLAFHGSYCCNLVHSKLKPIPEMILADEPIDSAKTMTTEELLRRECQDRRELKLYVRDSITINICIPSVMHI